ncbi:MAG: hypothetical protein J0M07_18075 [Anaerolineae bacterium]|uniref:hypothetical protein n=1 Tax=Candidatus Flexifilum breve TaxID=3140694 RepID=UPI001ACDC02D|nr:hypothetical protein [Chloroflexota bacterium]MBN8637239.1 hypothetical protein [Anaerolineae bacterium]
MQWLKDTYNGLVVVLLKPYLPRRVTLFAILLGILIGFLGAYVLFPTQYYDGDLRTLEQTWQNEWVKLLADRYAGRTSDTSAFITDALRQVDNPLGIVDTLLATPEEAENYAKLQAIRPLAEAAQPTAAAAPPEPTALDNLRPFLIVPIVTLLVVTIVIIIYGMFIYPNLIEPLSRRGQKPDPVRQAEKENREAAKKAFETQKTDFSAAANNYGPPLMQKMSTYTKGFGSYDDSFTIEDAEEKFLGETGALIAEGVTTDGSSTAFEVWLFDKDDFVRTMTKVFASEHAFNDPGVRSKLEEKGDVVLAQPGAILVLETAALRLQARIIEMQYVAGTPIPNSQFQKLTLELAAWQKARTGAPATVTAPAAPPLAPITQPLPPVQPTYTPAPTQPIYTPPPPPVQPAPQPYTPAGYGTQPPIQRPPLPQQPPPAPPPRTTPDDDPFGGTGDFTPIT